VTPLDEQTVLVTGATGGLGRALVRRFADHGTHVVAHGRSTDRLGELVTEVESATGQHIDTVQADLAELRDVDRLADELIARYDALHVLVNNAGVGFGAPGAAREESADGIELRFAVNHLAAYRLAWAALIRCPPERVRAAFHYVRQDVTLRPVDLLDADGLRGLVASVPAGA